MKTVSVTYHCNHYRITDELTLDDDTAKILIDLIAGRVAQHAPNLVKKANHLLSLDLVTATALGELLPTRIGRRVADVLKKT